MQEYQNAANYLSADVKISPLQYAAGFSNYTATKILLKHGANIKKTKSLL